MSQLDRLEKVVILGGGYAGTIAALRLARKLRRPLKLTLVDASEGLVERIRLHQIAAGQSGRVLPYRKLLGKRSVDFVHGRVTRLNPELRIIDVQQGEDRFQIGYDRLIYALGSTIDLLSVPGVGDYGFVLGSIGMAARLQKRLAELAMTGGRVLVCGGGLTGIESATEIAEAYPKLSIMLVTGDLFGCQLSQKGQRYLQRAFKRQGIEIREQNRVSLVEQDAVVLADGHRLQYDLCLWAGSFMVPKIAREAGLQVNERGQVIVDATLRSVSHPAVYAVGDAAIIAQGGGPVLRMACATAMPMGAHAADNISAELHNRPLSHFSFAYRGRCISLGRRDGLIQLVRSDDTPQERIVTGWLGSLIKELICRYTIWSIRQEQLGLLSYRWPRSKVHSHRDHRGLREEDKKSSVLSVYSVARLVPHRFWRHK